MIVGSVELTIAAESPFGRRPRVPAEPVGEDRWIISDLCPVGVPLVPGDVVEAREGVVTALVTPSGMGLVSVMPRLSDAEQHDLTATLAAGDARGRLMQLTEAVRKHCRYLSTDGIMLWGVPYNGEAVKAIEALPGVMAVEIERFPNGLVYERPLAVDQGSVVPVTLEWVERIVRLPEFEDPDAWKRLQGVGEVPDTLPDGWAD